MNEKSYLTPSLSNSPSSGNPPPPYRYPTTASTTPSTSRPSSRPSSPPPLPHGSSLPTSPININNNNSNGSPGTFSLNLGGGRYGGYYVIKLPMIIQRILGLLLRRWKSLLFIAIFGTLAAFGMFGAMWTEWREMTYTRVDPYPRIPTQYAGTGEGAQAIPGELGLGGINLGNQNQQDQPSSTTTSNNKQSSSSTNSKPNPSNSKYQSCPGPLSKPIPHSPSSLYKTPSNHPLPLVGSYSQLNLDNSKCLTYKSRYEMYTDEALGIIYRLDVDEEEEKWRKEREELWDNDPDNPKPIYNPDSNPSNGNGNFNSGSTNSDPFSSAPNYNRTDPLFGPKKPRDMDEGNWERYLRDRMWKSNVRSEELGPTSFPDWRALMDNCFEQRERERGLAGGVERFDWNDPNRMSGDGNGGEDFLSNGGKDSGNVFGGTTTNNGGGNNGYGNDREGKGTTTPETKRTALVMRSYEGYVWREDDILNLRALISELSLNNPSTPYDIRILVEVHGRHLSVFTSEWDRLNVLRSSVPREFWGMVELWTEDEMCALYPGLPGKFLNHMFAQSSYRSCLMALQKFYLDHQEYDFIYNWEMDVRYIGNYLDFFEGIEDYSRREAMHVGLDKYDTWFVRNVTASERNWADNTTITEGRGQEADLITLGPIFDPRGSGWFWEYDVQNYPPGQETDRRASIGTNMRMSRGLLDAMNVVNAEAKKSLHCEAWPTTLVLHSQLPTSHDHSFYPEAGFTHNLPLPFKGVFVPHPVYFRHHWDQEVLHSRINRPDFYKQIHEKVMRDSSFYYDGAHSKEIYVGWKANENVCRAPSLLHPIKRIN